MQLESTNRAQFSVLESENERLKHEVKVNIKELDDMRVQSNSLNEKLLQLEVMKGEVKRAKDLEEQLRKEKSETQDHLGELKIELAVMKNKLETSVLNSKREEQLSNQRVKDAQEVINM